MKTPTKRKVIEQMLMEGITIAEIADKFGMTSNLVRNHCWHIYRERGVKNMQELLAFEIKRLRGLK